MNEKEKVICLFFTQIEYDYLKDMCNSMYGALEKLPKKMRTEKFYILENMISGIFCE